MLETAGISAIVNGPITYTPDGIPLVGPILHKQNAYAITGLRAGLGEGGGHGWLLAQMIASHVQGGGDACYDTWCLDPRRLAAIIMWNIQPSRPLRIIKMSFGSICPMNIAPQVGP